MHDDNHNLLDDTYNMSHSDRAPSHKPFIYVVIGLSVFMILAFIHIINWDRHSFAVIPLKIKYALGLSNQSNYRELAKICIERMKYNCAESALSVLAESSNRVEDLIQLGDLRRKIGIPQAAVLAYEDALKLAMKESSNKELAEVHYGLAASFQSLQLSADAIRHYDFAIQAKPEVLQITVTNNYIRYLKQLGLADHIKRVVAEAKKRGGNERQFVALNEADL